MDEQKTPLRKGDLLQFYKAYPEFPANPLDPYYFSVNPLSGLRTKQIVSCNISPVQEFLRGSRYLNMIPVSDYENHIYGFILRSPFNEPKRFMNLAFGDFFLYGLSSFNDFTYGKKLLLVEGVKDCEAVKLFYPYCIAYLSSFPTQRLTRLFDSMTNRVVVISDNDRSTRSMVEKKTRQCGWFFTYPPCKDMGMVFDRDFDRSILEAYIRGVLSVSK